jgi:hypothetical protein
VQTVKAELLLALLGSWKAGTASMMSVRVQPGGNNNKTGTAMDQTSCGHCCRYVENESRHQTSQSNHILGQTRSADRQPTSQVLGSTLLLLNISIIGRWVGVEGTQGAALSPSGGGGRGRWRRVKPQLDLAEPGPMEEAGLIPIRKDHSLHAWEQPTGTRKDGASRLNHSSTTALL